MPRWFNTAGPCNPAIHYMLPATERLPNVERLVAQQGYFVIHAPRQTGKTTAMLEMGKQLTASGQYTAVMLSVEVGAAFSQDPDRAEGAILDAWRGAANVRLPPDLQPPLWPAADPGRRIGSALAAWSQASPRPLVIFIDEIDALQNQALISVLRQLRDGYPNRPQAFPQSLALIGLRDVRDYKVASGGSDRLNTASPFNIKVRSFTLQNFSREDVIALYQQHTHDTGQRFTPAALEHAVYLTDGQPWLVNALAKEVVEELVPDPEFPITDAHIDRAKEILIQRQDTHLDSLAERLREPRVKAIIEPMLAGQALADTPLDDRRFLLDLGLLKHDPMGGLTMANPIYREVIPRVLASGSEDSLPRISPSWLMPNGGLDTNQLLTAFLTFWRQHGEPLLKSAPYHEIAPHLVLMAFLHRVVNGGGTLEREYAIGTDRMDLCLRYGDVVLAIELKVWRQGRTDPLPTGLEQLDRYLSGLGQDTGWLVIFDRREGLGPISDRTTVEPATSPAGRQITVIRG
ncbi:ATP-binding protein [Nodosilinea sp. P-1105]|uniref:ATP-binding protein n=1 Tax=Nodosilinea sp. P-1105 TaxID=2546229 RepID=UPI00146E1D75|nr:ATP-binding protein [Nodosilinea sp. P-1105]NMF84056.1 ATP-binding protein [Nodosilinea sp. P-1105]